MLKLALIRSCQIVTLSAHGKVYSTSVRESDKLQSAGHIYIYSGL